MCCAATPLRHWLFEIDVSVARRAMHHKILGQGRVEDYRRYVLIHLIGKLNASPARVATAHSSAARFFVERSQEPAERLLQIGT